MNSQNIIKQLIPGLRANESWTQWLKSFIGGTFEDTVELHFKITDVKYRDRLITYVYVTEEQTESIGLRLGMENIVSLQCFSQDYWVNKSPAAFLLTEDGRLTMKIERSRLHDWRAGSIQKIRLSYKVTQTALPTQFEVQWPHYISTLLGNKVLNKLSPLSVAIDALRKTIASRSLQSEQQVDRLVVLQKKGQGEFYNPIRYLGFKWFLTTGRIFVDEGHVQVVVSGQLPPNIVKEGINCIAAEDSKDLQPGVDGNFECTIDEIKGNCAYGHTGEHSQIDSGIDLAIAFRYPYVQLHDSYEVDYAKVEDNLYGNDAQTVLDRTVEQKPAWREYTAQSIRRNYGMLERLWTLPSFGYVVGRNISIDVNVPKGHELDEYVVTTDSTLITSVYIASGKLHISAMGRSLTKVEKVKLTITNTTTGAVKHHDTYWCNPGDVPTGTITKHNTDIQLNQFGSFIPIEWSKESWDDVSDESLKVTIPFSTANGTSPLGTKYKNFTLELITEDGSIHQSWGEWNVVDGEDILTAYLNINCPGEALLRVVSPETGAGCDYRLRVNSLNNVQVQAKTVYMSGMSCRIPVKMFEGWTLLGSSTDNPAIIQGDSTDTELVFEFTREDEFDKETANITINMKGPLGTSYSEKIRIIKEAEIPNSVSGFTSVRGTEQDPDLVVPLMSPIYWIIQSGAELTLNLGKYHITSMMTNQSKHQMVVSDLGSVVKVRALNDEEEDLAKQGIGIGSSSVSRFIPVYSKGSSITIPKAKITVSIYPIDSATYSLVTSHLTPRVGDRAVLTVNPAPGYALGRITINHSVDLFKSPVTFDLAEENNISITMDALPHAPVRCEFSTTNLPFKVVEVDSEGTDIKTWYVGWAYKSMFDYGTRLRVSPWEQSSSYEFVGWMYKDSDTDIWKPVPNQEEGSQVLDVILTESRHYRCFWRLKT